MWEVLHLGDKLVKTQKHKTLLAAIAHWSLVQKKVLKTTEDLSIWFRWLLLNHFFVKHVEKNPHRKIICCVTNIHLQEEYKCKECNSTFRSHRTLKEHMQIHRSDTYSCHNCDKSFSCKAYLKQHSKTHSDEKKHCNVSTAHLRKIHYNKE